MVEVSHKLFSPALPSLVRNPGQYEDRASPDYRTVVA